MEIQVSRAITAFRATQVLIHRTMPGTLAMAVRKLYRELNNIVKDYEEERSKLLDEYVMRDVQGKFKSLDGEYQFESDERKTEFVQRHRDLVEAVVTIDHPLRSKGFDQLEIEPAILIDLDDLFLDGDDG